MKTIYILLFFVCSQIGFAQLIDPFEKVITHEIKMNKIDDGTYIGAIEWTTGGIDSLQRFVINDLDINAPVMVRILSKAPDHNIDLGFFKKNWDTQESKVSTNGEKFAEKIFRTMGTAGLGVRSKVAGIPYLITVKVGLQFPSTQSFIRVTNDKEEYERHMRKMGYQGELYGANSAANSSDSNTMNTGSNNSTDNSNLMYIIIGLLVAIAILLVLFLMKRKSSKITMLLVFCFGMAQFVYSQNGGPKTILPANFKPAVKDYKTQNVNNQTPINGENPNVSIRTVQEPVGDTGVMFNERTVRIETNQSSREIPSEEIADIERRMDQSDQQFDNDYNANMPGEPTEGDQRILPDSPDREEIERLRRQVRRLQQQVDLLSQEDEEYVPDENQEPEIVIYCEMVENCHNCIKTGMIRFNKRRGYLRHLQTYYLKKSTDLNDWIEYGNTLSSLPGGGGMAWGPILLHKVKPAMEQLKTAYSNKFDEYIRSLEEDLETIRACYTGENDNWPSIGGYEAQAFAVINALKASKIHK